MSTPTRDQLVESAQFYIYAELDDGVPLDEIDTDLISALVRAEYGLDDHD